MINCGVYAITNTVNGHVYIGSAVNISRRWNGHRLKLVNNRHGNSHLQNSWNKYGADCFEFAVLERCEIDRLIEREQSYIDSEKPVYNICLIAGSTLGVKHTDEARRNMSEARKGQPNGRLGTHHSEETLAKMSEALSGERNPMFGKLVSDETRRKNSEAHKGNHLSDETKRKIGKANAGEQGYMFGKHLSEEQKRKLSAAMKGNTNCLGRIMSEETKQLMSAQLKAFYKAQKELQLEPA